MVVLIVPWPFKIPEILVRGWVTLDGEFGCFPSIYFAKVKNTLSKV